MIAHFQRPVARRCSRNRKRDADGEHPGLGRTGLESVPDHGRGHGGSRSTFATIPQGRPPRQHVAVRAAYDGWLPGQVASSGRNRKRG